MAEEASAEAQLASQSRIFLTCNRRSVLCVQIGVDLTSNIQHQKRKGRSSTRTDFIEEIEGGRITFLDGKDWVTGVSIHSLRGGQQKTYQ